jgi:hypothetical protein
MAKATRNKTNMVLPRKRDLNLRMIPVKCQIWSMASCDAAILTHRKVFGAWLLVMLPF